MAKSPIQVKNALLKAINESVPIDKATIITAVTVGVKISHGRLMKNIHQVSLPHPSWVSHVYNGCII